jgi:S1-C subfamily serine protease
LRPGDILRQVNGRPVESSRDARAALEGAVNTLTLDLLRDGQRLTLRFRI